ncbi:MAG: dTDP-4-dehydrorhamnose 3,5-epimerase [Bacteroidetes bacterium]|nr:dTDP-4-dehydrorhamnose 3,5-epimerase [Bacteroidota bacterium]
MIFNETKLKGAYIIEIEKKGDERGFFARAFDHEIFQRMGLASKILQCNISYNKKKGTIRGMHFQQRPFQEVKLLRCTKGSIFDVIIDIRPNSETYKQWISIELTENNYKMLYAPEGFAAGFQTLEDNTSLFYQVSQMYMPEYERGIKWDDPSIRINWPLKPTTISEKDQNHPPFTDGKYDV